MTKPLYFINAVPDSPYYTWQMITFLESARDFGYSDKCHVLLFRTNDSKGWNSEWEQVEKLFPEVSFFRYEDLHAVTNLVKIYIPIIRPYCLWRHFKDHPELANSTIFYHDCDIIFTQPFDFSVFSDDICYLSDARGYTNATYFKSKIKDVLPDKADKYPDILESCAAIVGITKQIIEENNENSGGAQYILNGVDAPFFQEMITHCINIYVYLGHINQNFFESENKGFQRWCTDMFVLMWLLWKRGIKTEISKELDFAWSTDKIDRLEKVKILHNAGITSDSKIRTRHNKEEVECPSFYKGKYYKTGSPYDDEDYVRAVLDHPVSSTFCNHVYLKKVIDTAKKYLLTNYDFKIVQSNQLITALKNK